MTRILIVDDHPVVREGLTAVMADEPDFAVVAQAETGEAAVREVVRTRPDVVVMDQRLPGMSGTQACEQMLKRVPSVRVIILTSFPHEGSMIAAFSAGARGFLLKESEPSVFRYAVRTVATGGTFTDPHVAGQLVALATNRRRVKGPYGLSVQEMRVVEFLPRGLTNKEIGAQLGLSPDTVKTHLRNAMRKMGAKDRVEAAGMALKEGLA